MSTHTTSPETSCGQPVTQRPLDQGKPLGSARNGNDCAMPPMHAGSPTRSRQQKKNSPSLRPRKDKKKNAVETFPAMPLFRPSKAGPPTNMAPFLDRLYTYTHTNTCTFWLPPSSIVLHKQPHTWTIWLPPSSTLRHKHTHAWIFCLAPPSILLSEHTHLDLLVAALKHLHGQQKRVRGRVSRRRRAETADEQEDRTAPAKPRDALLLLPPPGLFLRRCRWGVGGGGWGLGTDRDM